MSETQDDKHVLVEIYRLHAELADHVSQRRDTANRIYATLSTGLLALMAAVARFGTGEIPVPIAIITMGVFGMILQGSWITVLKSYRQLNSGKFEVLHLLETKLPFDFFKREWEVLAEGKEPKKKYRRLTVSERTLPWILLFFYAGITSSATIWQIMKQCLRSVKLPDTVDNVLLLPLH